MKKFKPNDIWENLFLSKLFLFASLTCTCVNQVHKFPVYCFRRCLREDVRRYYTRGYVMSADPSSLGELRAEPFA